MSGLGRFLEISIQTHDVPESLNWYKLLGFAELTTGDMWSHKYAVVSDGVLCIGLHDREFDSPAITFVQPDLARHARSMADHGFNFSFMRLGEESFNVTQGAVKFNVELSSWSWCDNSGSCRSADGVGAAVELDLDINLRGSTPQSNGNGDASASYELGGGQEQRQRHKHAQHGDDDQ